MIALTKFTIDHDLLDRLINTDDDSCFVEDIGYNMPLPFVIVLANRRFGSYRAAFMVKTAFLDRITDGIATVTEIVKILIENLLSALVLKKTGVLRYASGLVDTALSHLPF